MKRYFMKQINEINATQEKKEHFHNWKSSVIKLRIIGDLITLF
jgi:hypothetical protein